MSILAASITAQGEVLRYAVGVRVLKRFRLGLRGEIDDMKERVAALEIIFAKRYAQFPSVPIGTDPFV